MKPTLVVLAAGLGRRFGGDKQTTGLGPHGEWLVEYSVHDALEAGFGKIVVVTRAELADELRARLALRIGNRADLAIALQATDDVPDGCRTPTARIKPLGTGHALWCCRAWLDAPFAVVNADDYYGASAFGLLTAHFDNEPGPAMVGYRLVRTLSEHGGVNRGVCRVDDDDGLLGVVEYTDIRVDGDRRPSGLDADGHRQPLSADAIVSLNCWGLRPDILPVLEHGLREFLAREDDDAEYYLPAAIDRSLADAATRLVVLRSDEDWAGLTHAADRPAVQARLASRAVQLPVP